VFVKVGFLAVKVAKILAASYSSRVEMGLQSNIIFIDGKPLLDCIKRNGMKWKGP
jgi:hypothetical protein